MPFEESEDDYNAVALKDFYDIWSLAEKFPFDGDRPAAAIGAAFRRRGTVLPVDEPLALTPVFARDTSKQTQWTAFTGRSALRGVPPTLEETVKALRLFLLPAVSLSQRGERFEAAWQPGGPWIRRLLL